LERYYRSLPDACLTALFGVLMALFKRSDEAQYGVGAFCYEDSSRLLWNQFGGRIGTESVTGVPGTSALGMNSIQKMWVAFNQVEDLRTQSLVGFQNAKFVASAHNPKGVKQVSMKEENRLKREEGRRHEEMDHFYYRQIGVLDDQDQLADGRKIVKEAHTPEELMEEYRRWVEGDKDKHDLIVEDYKARVMARYEEEQRRFHEPSLPEQMSEELPEEFVPRKLVGYDVKQLQGMLEERSPGQRKNVKRVYDGQRKVRQEHVYQQHLVKPPSAPPPGGFKLTQDGKIAMPNAPENLQEEIAARKHRYSSKPTQTS
jgi:hypothetical protein